MSRKCQLTGKRRTAGNNVSHSNRKTKRSFLPNIIKKRMWVPSLKRYVNLKISANALRTIDKKGIDAVIDTIIKEQGA